MIKEIKTSKFTGLAVLVPDESVSNSLNTFDGYPFIQFAFKTEPFGKSFKILKQRLGYNPYEIIGQWPGLTEEQAAEIVDFHIVSYKDYKTSAIYHYKTGIESFKSLMDKLKCYSLNPLQSLPPTNDLLFYDSIHDYDICVEKWEQAQSNTGIWLILKII